LNSKLWRLWEVVVKTYNTNPVTRIINPFCFTQLISCTCGFSSSFFTGSVTTITSKQLRVTGTDRTISYVITRDPNVGKLQYARNNNVEDLSADEDNQFTQEEIDEGMCSNRCEIDFLSCKERPEAL